LFKIILIGDSYAGKSSILSQYCDEGVSPSFITTIGLDFKVKTVMVQDKRIKLQVWDTAGQERFRTLTRSYYRKAMGAILAYDVSDRRSFDHITEWMVELQQQTNENKQTVVPIIVGNKVDLMDRKVQPSEGVTLAARFNCKFCETSAKQNIGITQLFDTLLNDIYTNLVPSASAMAGTKESVALAPTDKPIAALRCCNF
jgi:Ras-related protein Rab-8A